MWAIDGYGNGYDKTGAGETDAIRWGGAERAMDPRDIYLSWVIDANATKIRVRFYSSGPESLFASAASRRIIRSTEPSLPLSMSRS